MLVVEDQFLVADEMHRTVKAMGGEVIGPARNLETAMEMLGHETPDLALLDINLKDEKVFPIARELSRRKVTYIFTTGYETWTLPPEFQGDPHLEKPVTWRVLAEMIRTLQLP